MFFVVRVLFHLMSVFPCIVDDMKKQIQLDVTQWFIELLIRSDIYSMRHITLCYSWSWVWCEAVSYVSGLKDVAQATSLKPDTQPTATHQTQDQL